MLIKVPILQKEPNGHVLQSATRPYATYRKAVATQQKTCFLTQHVLIYVLHGHKRLHYNEQSFTVADGHIMMLKRGFYMMSEFVADGLDYEALLLYYTDEDLKRFLHKFGLSAAAPVTAPPLMAVRTNALLEDFRTQYMGYFRQNMAGLETILQLKLYELFLLLLAGPQRQQVLAFMQSVAYAQPLEIDYIVRKHLFQPLTLDELARLSGRSLASFKRDFQQQYHCPPKKWINEQRLAHARMLLQRTDKQVSEIALDCGFENIPHFIRIFKQEFGVTPNAIRAKNAIV